MYKNNFQKLFEKYLFIKISKKTFLSNFFLFSSFFEYFENISSLTSTTFSAKSYFSFVKSLLLHLIIISTHQGSRKTIKIKIFPTSKLRAKLTLKYYIFKSFQKNPYGSSLMERVTIWAITRSENDFREGYGGRGGGVGIILSFAVKLEYGVIL